MSNTRFEPTTNGSLHLGHVFIATLNREIAHQSGGKFIVRLDDAGLNLLPLGRERIDRISRMMYDQMEWLGLIPDKWEVNSELWPAADKVLNLRGVVVPEEPLLTSNYQPTPVWLAQPNQLIYPYTPQLTARKVVLDWLAGIDLLIRGEEIATEVSLYSYYCDVLKYPKPTFVHVPRLHASSGGISKTNGNFMVSSYQANGYSPEEVGNLVAAAVLKNPANGWSLLNLKEAPCL